MIFMLEINKYYEIDLWFNLKHNALYNNIFRHNWKRMK